MEDLENIQNNGMVTTLRQAQSTFFLHISDYSYLPTIGSRHVQDWKEALSPKTFRYSKGFMVNIVNWVQRNSEQMGLANLELPLKEVDSTLYNKC